MPQPKPNISDGRLHMQRLGFELTTSTLNPDATNGSLLLKSVVKHVPGEFRHTPDLIVIIRLGWREKRTTVLVIALTLGAFMMKHTAKEKAEIR